MSDTAENEWQEVQPNLALSLWGRKRPLAREIRTAGVPLDHLNDVGYRHRDDKNTYQFAKKRSAVILTQDKQLWDDRVHPLQGCPGVIVVEAQGNQAITGLVFC